MTLTSPSHQHTQMSPTWKEVRVFQVQGSWPFAKSRERDTARRIQLHAVINNDLVTTRWILTPPLTYTSA